MLFEATVAIRLLAILRQTASIARQSASAWARMAVLDFFYDGD
jgi:hypothetical protein